MPLHAMHRHFFSFQLTKHMLWNVSQNQARPKTQYTKPAGGVECNKRMATHSANHPTNQPGQWLQPHDTYLSSEDGQSQRAMALGDLDDFRQFTPVGLVCGVWHRRTHCKGNAQRTGNNNRRRGMILIAVNVNK